ncbi:SMP-30/gluconolactonase/LRE family protein [Alteromonas sp. IB21]|uniref:SMP-30/gluconolactonase/LRE family protein n=1 Tax=Alteromonas sp. IB21 TaxID=2779369 RepID=UPI0018E7D207|nr:SMP-30/gluconolactonase/LRE family protein [Alteromonas sp. IB21]MBJ2130233.1 SMP-30/gluconolactonase/LRE family protein [Alteromonas sp. IB21]
MKAVWCVLSLFTVYLLLWPVPIEPVAWQAPENKGFEGKFAQNTRLSELTLVDMGNDYGPEDFALNQNGTLATSSHSGAILLKKKGERAFNPWVNTSGRPLGIEYDSKGNLLVADAHLGLLKINSAGEVSVLVDNVNDSPVVYADDVDIARSGKIYFTDATTKFPAMDYGGTLKASLLEIFEHKGNGRLIEYNPDTGNSAILMDKLVFANGVAVSHDEQSILVNETGKYRVLRYWLEGPNKGQVDVLIDNLPGFPDNISRAESGSYYIGLASPRSAPVDILSDKPFIRKIVQRLPGFMRPQGQPYGHLVKISENGEIEESWQDPTGAFPFVTGAIKTKEGLYISSLTAHNVGLLR